MFYERKKLYFIVTINQTYFHIFYIHTGCNRRHKLFSHLKTPFTKKKEDFEKNIPFFLVDPVFLKGLMGRITVWTHKLCSYKLEF